MKLQWVPIGFLALLNVALLGSNWFLSSGLRAVSQQRVAEEGEALRQERAQLDAYRARLDEKLHLLSGLAGQLKEELSRRDAPYSEPHAEPGAGDDVFDVDRLFASAALEAGSERPKPAEISLMTDEEKADLKAKRNSMPEVLSENLLIIGDVDAVLASKEWNPRGREPSAAERGELARLLTEYRYFGRLSGIERFHTMVEPMLPAMREAGAFVEYRADEPPPAVPEACSSHAEPSTTPGYKRLYYFFPDDHPELAHHKKVEQERALERFVQVYYLINGDAEGEAEGESNAIESSPGTSPHFAEKFRSDGLRAKPAVREK